MSAATRPESVPALALEKALLQFEICACDDTLAELETVLKRAKFDRYVPPDIRQEFVAGFRQRVTKIAVAQTVTDCIDPKDIPVAHGFSRKQGASPGSEDKAQRRLIASPIGRVEPRGFTGAHGCCAQDRRAKQDCAAFRCNAVIGRGRRALRPKTHV